MTATGGTGNINLYAGDSMEVDALVTVSAASTGAILAQAGTNFNDGTPANGYDAVGTDVDGDIVMEDGSTIQSAAGLITLDAIFDFS